MRRNTSSAGFTLIELLVAMLVLVIFMIGILGMLDNSRRIAKTESALADTQENVRYAAYHVMRTARMAGGAGMPFAQDNGGSTAWIAGEIKNNQSGTLTDDFSQARTLLAGSDVLTLRGFFEHSPYFVDANADIDWGTGRVTIRENVTGIQNMNVAANDFQDKGLAFMGRGRFAIAEVTGNSAPSGAAGTRTMTVDFQDPTGVWVGLNPGGAYPTMPAFEVYRVGVFDSYTYFVAPDFQLRRVRAGAGVATAEPVAINVGNLQVALGMDIDDDGAVNTWFQAPTLADATTGTPMALRITVLGRTRETVMDWEEKPATFQVEDLNINTVDRSAKWRRMQVVAMLRDFVL